MPVIINQFETEVIAESDARATGATPAATGGQQDDEAIRATLASIARDALRTRAEGFDD